MFNLGLLSDAALTGLSDEEKNSLQKQATQQFLLGSLLSNDPSMGLKSALSVPDQYLSGQRAITEMQQKAADRASIANFQGKYMPTKFNEASPQYMGPVTPDVAMQQDELKTARAQGLPFNIQNALQDVINLPSASQSSMLGAITSLQPKMQPSGILTNANMQPIGGLPSFDARSGLVSRPTVQGGNVDFNISAAPGFAKATALNTLPELEKGQQYVFDNNQNVIGLMDVNGKLQSLAARTATETAAREANIPRPSTTSTGAPTFTYATPPGLIGGATQPVGVNQPAGVVQPTTAQPVTGPSTAQTILNQAYKPILDDAYKGFQTAKKTAPVIDQLQNAYNQPGFDTGSFTGLRTQLGNVFNSLGVSGERNKQFLTNAISARQGINALTGESLSEAVGAISNFEIGYYGQRNAQITDPKESTNFNLAVLREANKRKEDFYNFVSDPKNAGPDVLAKWSASPQGQKQMFESPGLRKYLPQFQVNAGPDKGKTAYQLPSGVYRVYD
jgi:hypothetical protein